MWLYYKNSLDDEHYWQSCSAQMLIWISLNIFKVIKNEFPLKNLFIDFTKSILEYREETISNYCIKAIIKLKTSSIFCSVVDVIIDHLYICEAWKSSKMLGRHFRGRGISIEVEPNIHEPYPLRPEGQNHVGAEEVSLWVFGLVSPSKFPSSVSPTTSRRWQSYSWEKGTQVTIKKEVDQEDEEV